MGRPPDQGFLIRGLVRGTGAEYGESNTGTAHSNGVDMDDHEYVEQDSYAYDGVGGGLLDNMAVTDHDGGITVDTADGAHDIGPATVDTDNDGRLDTAVVHAANGDTVLYTDSQGDGQA